MCRVLGVSESGYYKSQRTRMRPPRHANLLAQIYELLREDEENAAYGMRRIYLGLKTRRNYKGSYRTITRICHENNLVIKRKKGPKSLTKADSEAQKAENLIKQDFTASRPNEKWLTDITEIPCADGKLYLAPVFDCFDGSIRAYKLDTHMKTELCVEAFELACQRDRAHGMILHSDRGSQFTSRAFREALKKHGAVQSMSGTGRCYDNARMESFFATLKKEKLYRDRSWLWSMEEVRSMIYRYICYYNLRRVYSTNGGLPPELYRRAFLARNAAA